MKSTPFIGHRWWWPHRRPSLLQHKVRDRGHSGVDTLMGRIHIHVHDQRSCHLGRLRRIPQANPQRAGGQEVTTTGDIGQLLQLLPLCLGEVCIQVQALLERGLACCHLPSMATHLSCHNASQLLPLLLIEGDGCFMQLLLQSCCIGMIEGCVGTEESLEVVQL